MEATPTSSPPSKGRYRRYNNQNEAFEEWLKRTARQVCERTGNPTQIPSELNTTTTLKLAQLIHNARERIAPGIISMLKDIISQRKKALACYRAFSRSQSTPVSDTLQAANEVHQHYIEILQMACKLLEPLAHRTSKQAADPHTGDTVSNALAKLAVEEPSQDPFGPEKESTSASSGKKATLTSEVGDQGSWRKITDTMLAIYCYFEDMQHMRNYLSGLWTRFYEGKINFQVASHLTDAAFHLIRELDFELQMSFPNLDSMARVLSSIDPRINNPDDIKVDKTREDGPATAKFFCIAGWQTMSDFINAPTMQAGSSGTCIFQHPFAVELRKIRPELLELSEIVIPESMLKPNWMPSEADMQRLEAGGLERDILTTELLISLREERIPSYLVVFIEVMHDIYDVFGGHLSFPYQILQDAARTVKNGMQHYIDQTEPQEWEALRKKCEKMMNQFSQQADMILDDKLFEKDSRLPKPTGIQPSKLFITLPLLTGRNLLSIYTHRYVCAHSLMTDTPIMLCAGYLYIAAKLFDNKLDWPAMEFFIETQSKQKSFIRTVNDKEKSKDKDKDKARSKDVVNNWKLFCLALGFSGKSVPNLTPGTLTKMRKVEVAHSWIVATNDAVSMAGNESGTADEFYRIIIRTLKHAQREETVLNYDKLIPLLNDLEQTLSAQALELTFDYTNLLSDCQHLVDTLHSGNLIFGLKGERPFREADFVWAGLTVMRALKEDRLPNMPSKIEETKQQLKWRRAATHELSDPSKDLGLMPTKNVVANADKPCNTWKMFARNSAISLEEAAE